MARQTFFSFHYANDVWRASVVRNSNVVARTTDQVGYYDKGLWESARTTGDAAVRRLIDRGLAGASVTVVLVGAETAWRRWVLYEIEKSHKGRKGLLAIRIHGIRDRHGRISVAGPNPFDRLTVRGYLRPRRLSEIYPLHDWVADDGYTNAAGWIEQAARAAGR